ncbi:MAG: PQQ-binding-like beta-propeller repeat protein [Phycisphaerae bacterium]
MKYASIAAAAMAASCAQALAADGAAPATQPVIRWKLQGEAMFTGSPAFDDTAVYAGDRAGNLYAASKADGGFRKLWQIKLPDITNCTPTLSGDSVYIGSHDGSVVRVKKAGGAIAWTFKRDKPGTVEDPKFVWDGVAVDDKNVYFGTADGKVFAVSIDNGQKAWEFTADKAVVDGKEVDGKFMAKPALADGKVFIGSFNKKVYCLSAADGRKVWEYQAPDAVSRAVAMGTDLLYFVAGSDLVALDRAGGQKKWSFTSERKYRSHPTVYGNYVLAAGDFGRTYVLSAADGKIAWSFNLPDATDGTLAVVSDRIYFNSPTMLLCCANFRSGIPVWTHQFPSGGQVKAPSPAVDNGVVYLTTRMTLRTNNPAEVAVSNCILAIAGPSDDLYGRNPVPPAWNLKEVHARVLARHNKPYQLLKDDKGFFQSEMLIFNDPRTGSEIIKFSDDPSANYHHSGINRPSYNANGSKLIMHSSRAYYPGRYVLNADGTAFRRIDLENWLLNFGILPCWDRKDPNIVYANDKTALYKVNVETLKTVKVCDLPDPDRPKAIFSYPSADNTLILMLGGPKVYLAKTDGSGVTTIDLPNPKAKELAPKHDPKWEQQGAHDIFFILGPDNTISFNYGPTASVGEGIFYEMSEKGDLLRVIYPYTVKGGSDPIYYSHPGWRQDGAKVAYFGYGGPGLGWGFFMRDRDGANPVKLSKENIGGHCGWDNFDNDWVFASPSVSDKSEYGGTICRFRTDGSMTGEVLCDARPAKEYNGSYSAIPRVSPSPDGTKAIFTSSFMGSPQFIDMYSVVVKRPDPPDVGVKRTLEALDPDGKNFPHRWFLTWTPPRLSREVMGYNVYASVDGKAWKLITSEPTKEKEWPMELGKQYAVTSVEWSGLESLEPSRISSIVPVFQWHSLEAESADYSMPIQELRDMKAANWFAIQNTADKEAKATIKVSPNAPLLLSVYARVKGGAWTLAINDAEIGKAASDKKDEWTWIKLDKTADVKGKDNVLTMTSSTAGAAIDKIIFTTDDKLQPIGRMYLDETPPGEVKDLKAVRMDRTLLKLTWSAPADKDVRYYNVYYAPGAEKPAIDQACRIASVPAAAPTQYIDFAAKPGAQASYAVTAVDRFGNESKPVFAQAE